MDEASATTVARERLEGFGEVRVRLRLGRPALVAFEVLRRAGGEAAGDDGDGGDDGVAWTLPVPWAAREDLRRVLTEAAAELGRDGGAEAVAAAFDEQGVALLARAGLGDGDELAAVILRQADERAFAVWRREPPPADGGGDWRWTADVVVVPEGLAPALCGAMLGALGRLAEAEAAAASWRARSSPPADARPAMVASPHGIRRRPTGLLRLLGLAAGHLLSFEAAFVLFLYSNELQWVLPARLPVDETALFGALAVAAGGSVVLREGIYLRGLPVVAAALLFIAWAVASSGWTPSRSLVGKDVSYLLTFTLLSVLAGGLVIANSRRRAVRFFALALCVALLMALYGLHVYLAYGDFRRWAGWRDSAGRVYLDFGHTVVNGAGIAFAAALFARLGSLRQAAAGVVFAACAGFLLVGGGRGPFLGVALAALLGLAARPPMVEGGRDRRLAVPGTTVAVGLMVALAATYVAYLAASGGATTTLARFAKLLDEAQNPGMIMEVNRFAYWSAAYRYWLEAPLVGHGLASFSPLFLGGREVPGTHPHNIFLQSLCELGIVGLVLLGGFLWVAGRHACFRRLRRDPLMVCALLFVATSAMSALFGRDIVGVRKFFFAVSLLALRPPPARVAAEPARDEEVDEDDAAAGPWATPLPVPAG